MKEKAQGNEQITVMSLCRQNMNIKNQNIHFYYLWPCGGHSTHSPLLSNPIDSNVTSHFAYHFRYTRR
ncbi:uncharacterized protein DS421_3g79740 [Arachis hypogaea]|nr:uncharacterized protein DS421_3g79740 [Arachis hypogaea]